MRRASLVLIAATAALVLALVAATLSIVAVTRNHTQTVTLNPSNAPDKRTVSVSGTGIASLAPDIARFWVGVLERGPKLTDVQATVAQKTDAIITALVKGGLDKDKDLKTTGYAIQPIYDYPKEKAPVVTGYQVTNTINATVRGLDKNQDKIGPLLDAVVQAGANNIGSITFGLANPDQANQIARQEAMKNAQSKADALAQAGGAKLGIVITVSDQTVTPGPPREVQAFPVATAAAASAAAPPTAILSGETSVTVTVNVTYALQ
ncbi:MAG: SIMPL domain-containing protein [Thermomicrobiales bacterium]